MTSDDSTDLKSERWVMDRLVEAAHAGDREAKIIFGNQFLDGLASVTGGAGELWSRDSSSCHASIRRRTTGTSWRLCFWTGAVRLLRSGKLKMSARDAARLLGVSHQRVHQLTTPDHKPKVASKLSR